MIIERGTRGEIGTDRCLKGPTSEHDGRRCLRRPDWGRSEGALTKVEAANSAMPVGILRRKPMLDWIGTKILALMTLLPAVFVDEKSPNFTAIRAMFGLGFIVLVAYLIAMRPFRSAIARCMRAMSNLAAWKR
jgi:hypothetical protein